MAQPAREIPEKKYHFGIPFPVWDKFTYICKHIHYSTFSAHLLRLIIQEVERYESIGSLKEYHPSEDLMKAMPEVRAREEERKEAIKNKRLQVKK